MASEVGLLRMWISLGSMGAMFISVVLIMLSRYKFNNAILKFISALIAYVLMILSGLIIFFIIFSGPVSE